jgi:hypothetical protein
MNRVIETQDDNGRPADRRQADDVESIEGEMFGPGLPSWMKQGNQFAGFWVDSRQVRTLVEVACDACEGKIGQGIRSAVLSSDDMFNLMTDERRVVFV